MADLPLRVRRALVRDRPLLLDLWERSVRATHDFLSDMDIATLRPQVAEALASHGVDWWVLESATRTAIGLLGYTEGAVEALFIDPAHFRRGGGRFLVEHAQGLAPGSLAVDVNEQNPAAVRFYERLGFSVVGRSPTDSGGRPFPILHMRRPVAGDVGGSR